MLIVAYTLPLCYIYANNFVQGGPMRRTITILAFLFLLWIMFDVAQIQDVFLNFLLVGVVPGTETALSPSLMLAIMTALSGIIIFEILARNLEIIRKIRKQFLGITATRERLPKRRFNRIVSKV